MSHENELTLTMGCPVGCSGGDAAVGATDGYMWRRCNDCGSLFVDTRPTNEELQDYYSTYYGADNLDPPAFVRRRLDEIVASFSAHRRTAKLLDVGFGAGALLDAASRAGWECWGTEIDQRIVDEVTKPGWKTFAGELGDVGLPQKSFDVVCAVEVIEHVTDPRALLDAIRPLMRDGGLFFGTTPAGRGLSARVLRDTWSVAKPPEHLQLFSRQGLRSLLTSSGFEVSEVRTEALGVGELRGSIRARSSGTVTSAGDRRVEESYALNEALLSSRRGRVVKRAANTILNLTGLGDSLKFWATTG